MARKQRDIRISRKKKAIEKSEDSGVSSSGRENHPKSDSGLLTEVISNSAEGVSPMLQVYPESHFSESISDSAEGSIVRDSSDGSSAAGDMISIDPFFQRLNVVPSPSEIYSSLVLCEESFSEKLNEPLSQDSQVPGIGKVFLRKSDLDSPVDIYSPEEIFFEEEYVSYALEKGTIVNDRYEILQVLSEVRGQVTYLVEYEETRKKQVLKELIPDSFSVEDFKIRKTKFRDSVRMLMNNTHGNLVSVIDTFSEQNREYCVIEHFAGLTLEDLMSVTSKGLKEKELLEIGLQICDGVEFLHYRPLPFTLDSLVPGHITIGMDRTVKISDYDFRRFFDSRRSLDFLPDNPTNLYSDMTKLGRLLFFLLTNHHYDGVMESDVWPIHVSEKMKKFLHTVCVEGQQSVGDIRKFRERFLETQVKDSTPETQKSRSFPVHTVNWNLLLSRFIDFDRNNPMVKVLIGIFSIILLYFVIITNLAGPPGFKHPVHPVILVSTPDSLNVYDSKDMSLLYSHSVRETISVMHSASIKYDDGSGSKEYQCLLLGYANSSILDILDMRTLKSLTSINLGVSGPSKIIPDDSGRLLFILCPGSNDIVLVDLDKVRVTDSFFAGSGVSDAIYFPSGKVKVITRESDTSSPVPSKKNVRKIKPSKRIITLPEREEVQRSLETPRPACLGVSNPGVGSIRFVDAYSGRYLGDLPVGGKPGRMVLSRDYSTLYVVDTRNMKLLRISPRDFKITGEYSLKGINPSDLVMDSDNMIWLIDEDKNRLVHFNPRLGTFQEYPTSGQGPRSIYHDGSSNTLWVLNAQSKSISILDTDTVKGVNTIDLGKTPLKAFFNTPFTGR